MPKLYTLTPENHEQILRLAAARLCQGGVAIIPTDTVYGLAAHPDFPEAVSRLSTIKGRVQNKPIALLAANLAAVHSIGAVLSPTALRLAQAHWPGGLTLVLPCGSLFEGFRIPDHHFCRDLLAACGGTLRVTSANLSGSMPALNAASALAAIGLLADLIIDDGPSPGRTASTVVRATATETTILREGAIKIATPDL